MATAESQGNICQVCGLPIPSEGLFLDWSVRGCWPPFCSLDCYDRFITIAAGDTQGVPITVSNAQSARQPTRDRATDFAVRR